MTIHLSIVHRPTHNPDHKSFYIPRSKPNNDFFHSFLYPTSKQPVTTSPPHIALIEELPQEVTTTAPEVPATTAVVLPSATGDTISQSGGLTPETDDSVSDMSPSAFSHITWEAAAFGQNDFPDIINCLMDTVRATAIRADGRAERRTVTIIYANGLRTLRIRSDASPIAPLSLSFRKEVPLSVEIPIIPDNDIVIINYGAILARSYAILFSIFLLSFDCIEV
jgi:hypothetical protein